MYLNIEDAIFTYIYHEFYRFETSPQWKAGWGTVDDMTRGTYIQTIYSVSKHENKISPLLGRENQHQRQALLTFDKCSDIITKTHQTFISTLFY